jgi:hypothetical protein
MTHILCAISGKNECGGVGVKASLEPGKIYVIKVDYAFKTSDDVEAYKSMLEKWAPGCKFLILDRYSDILGAIPAVAPLPWTRFCACIAPDENAGYCSRCGYKVNHSLVASGKV